MQASIEFVHARRYGVRDLANEHERQALFGDFDGAYDRLLGVASPF